jgi:hypothetical protein
MCLCSSHRPFPPIGRTRPLHTGGAFFSPLDLEALGSIHAAVTSDRVLSPSNRGWTRKPPARFRFVGVRRILDALTGLFGAGGLTFSTYRHRPHASRVAGRARGDHRARLARQASDHRHARQRHRQGPLPGPLGQGIPAPFAPRIHGELGLRQSQDPPLQRRPIQPLRWLGAPPECDAGAAGSKPCSPKSLPFPMGSTTTKSTP